VCFCGSTGISSNNSFVQHPAADTIVLAFISDKDLTSPFINSAPCSIALLFKAVEKEKDQSIPHFYYQ
jgi:hypothetical protein